MDTIIKIKFSVDKIRALLPLCDCHINDFVAYDAHDLLLLEHLIELRQQLQGLSYTGKSKGIISFKRSSAVAFWQYWGTANVYDGYADLLTRDIIGAFDKVRPSLRPAVTDKQLSG